MTTVYHKSLENYGNHPNPRNLWKAKPSALNRQSEGM